VTAADRAVMDGIRTVTASAKGHVERGTFDAVMEQTLDAPQIAYGPGVVGAVAGVWCRPAGASSGPTILYFHGGPYIVGTAHAFRHLAGQVAVRANATSGPPQ
jgi:monoterpene epsilon-lactone hydrolase